ncbi:serine/threonine protein kinase [Luteolibacter pohnpeiensis]|uniref:Serine/threonine protein kinase n=1 Tax=Luteolibacter pohnpeiensis TaxID=454153 RepID=A0A934VVT4_9BACT|nr:serine/threonine-protein kinase [Luteolibacter pohnpeiensis]MBK1882545.1 serine/threonine protein kinase [Luteolibacter pohnpeiensis]
MSTARPVPRIADIAKYFPHLEIHACLGRGGMGVVYKARQISLDRWVALKLLAPECQQNPEFKERFMREAQALAKINHPNIVTVHDFGQIDEFYFLLMEFVDGANLRQLLNSHQFTPEQALAIVSPLCDALQYAHDRGIVHRDIKPENLLMDLDGKLKVADFGLVKLLDAVSPTDKHSVGTPCYMAPEQKTDPENVDNRADIYALGVVIYEMLTGELPGESFMAPSVKTPVDARLDDVVRRAMNPEPANRYQHASGLKTEVMFISSSWNKSECSSARAERPVGRMNVNRFILPACGLMIASSLAAGLNLISGLALFIRFKNGDFSASIPYRGLLPLELGYHHPAFTIPARYAEMLYGYTPGFVVLAYLILCLALVLNLLGVYGAHRMKIGSSRNWSVFGCAIALLLGFFMMVVRWSDVLSAMLALAQIGTGIWGLMMLVSVRSHSFPQVQEKLTDHSQVIELSNQEHIWWIKIPGIGLISAAGFNLALLLIAALGTLQGPMHSPDSWVQVNLLPVAIILQALVLWGSIEMRSKRGYPLALLGALCSMVTTHIVFVGLIWKIWSPLLLVGMLLGLVFGAWGFLSLLNPRVSGSFQRHGRVIPRWIYCCSGMMIILLMIVLQWRWIML